jgi:hypothetical protein
MPPDSSFTAGQVRKHNGWTRALDELERLCCFALDSCAAAARPHAVANPLGQCLALLDLSDMGALSMDIQVRGVGLGEYASLRGSHASSFFEYFVVEDISNFAKTMPNCRTEGKHFSRTNVQLCNSCRRYRGLHARLFQLHQICLQGFLSSLVLISCS